MDYQRIYNKIVERGKNRTLKEYKEKHHIIPRCIGGTNDKNNLVFLTPEEHYVCHQLLVKLYPTNSSLIFAANMLTVPTKYVRRNNKAYGWLKRMFSENTSGDNHHLRKNIEAREHNQSYMTGPNNPSKLNGPWNKGISVKLRKTDISENERALTSERMKNKNPMFGIKPWNHGRATDYTKSIWSIADEIYEVWIANDKPSYCRLHRLIRNCMYDNVSVGPFMNMVKYFRNDWVPALDIEWKKFKETNYEYRTI